MKYDKFKQLFLTVLNIKQAPQKVKLNKGNNPPFINIRFTKTFMDQIYCW